MGALIGIWFINNGILNVKIIGNLYWEKESIYRFCEQTESPLINVEDIDPIGYTKTPMALATIPEDIRKQLRKRTLKQKHVRMVRSLVSYSPFKEEFSSFSLRFCR